MNRTKHSIILMLLLMGNMVNAQTLKNPSFESGLTSWTNMGFNTQNNTAFTLKTGSQYVEKWVSRGNPVGDASLEQTVKNMTNGTYTLTVAAQNIQEDTPSAVQSGAWIYANDVKTDVGVTNNYKITFTVYYGEATIGFKAEGATGNWIAVDNFRLVNTGCELADMKSALEGDIKKAEAYTDSLMADSSMVNLQKVITAANDFVSSMTIDDCQERLTQMALSVKSAVSYAEKAVWDYKVAHASIDNLVDYTHLIVNPSFEDAFNGWTNSGMQAQSNTSFTKKQGTVYVEKWIDRGSKVGSCSVYQTITGLDAGIYILKAYGQNIQEDSPSTRQTGAYIFAGQGQTAVNRTGEYALQFTNIDGILTFGFEAENATGNWLAVDGFRLYYAGTSVEAIQTELLSRIEQAEEIMSNAESRMQTSVRETLNTAISNARTLYTKLSGTEYTPSEITNTADALRMATDDAKMSIKSYDALKKAIAEAENDYGTGGGNGADAYLAAINGAKVVYESLTSTNAELNSQITALSNASFQYRIDNATGAVPKVTTGSRYVSGCVEVFGRMSVSGVNASQIKEQGFCYSETNPEPDVFDKRSTDYLDHNGQIYRMPNEPGTLFYMRPYVITKGYAVGYGEVKRVSTLPQGHVTWSYDYGGDASQNDRIETALKDACGWWSNYTSINGFNIDCHYSPGTPTADCGYGGYMRMGTNMGQRCGTCLHEMGHGIGTGTIDPWGGYSNSPIRQVMNGDWCGDRANNAIRFWENDDNISVTGAYDGAHWGIHYIGQAYVSDGSGTGVWQNKYAINGAHLEPGAWAGPTDWNGTQVLFIGNSIINQGFCEDIIAPVNYWGGGFCLPAYVFEHQDDTKYYLKNEDEARGRYDSFLAESSNGTLKWVESDASTISDNDNAAWYISFDATRQYYTFQNAATGHYMSYSTTGANGMKGLKKTTAGDNERFHMIRRRQADADVLNEGDVRGYWIIHPQNQTAFIANANGSTGTTGLNLYDDAASQRWLILTAQEAEEMAQGETDKYHDMLAQLIDNLRTTMQTPHTENEEGTNSDAALKAVLDQNENLMASETNPETLKQMYADTRQAGVDFLYAVSPKDMDTPFDVTFFIENPSIAENTNGWSENGTISYKTCEFFEKTFDFNQTITGLPRGYYDLHLQAFQRPGSYTAAYNDYVAGNDNVSAELYISTKKTIINHIGAEAQTRKIGGVEASVGSPVRYIPDNMEAAGKYFDKGLYDNQISYRMLRKTGDLTIGIRGTETNSGYWTIFRNFRLYFYGENNIVGIDEIENDMADETENNDVYDLSGRKIDDASKAHRGIYIVGGKKVYVK